MMFIVTRIVNSSPCHSQTLQVGLPSCTEFKNAFFTFILLRKANRTRYRYMPESLFWPRLYGGPYATSVEGEEKKVLR
jgi:hypothetical protein